MRGCYSGGITAMSTNGPISVSMQALKIPQISQRLPNKITDSLNISEVWLQFEICNFLVILVTSNNLNDLKDSLSSLKIL